MLIRWLTMGVKWDGADQVSNIMKNTEIIKSVVPNNAMNEARNSRTVQYCSSLPPKLLSRGRSRSTSRQNRCHVEARKSRVDHLPPKLMSRVISPSRQILPLPPKSIPRIGGKKFKIEKFKIEIDSSIWREEIQNRYRLLDLAGRNSK